MAASSNKIVRSNISKSVLTYKQCERHLAFLKADALQKLAESKKNKIGIGRVTAPFIVDRDKIFHRMNDGQKEAGQYILNIWTTRKWQEFYY